jgi:MbtH protein
MYPVVDGKSGGPCNDEKAWRIAMNQEEIEDNTIYKVVVNHEEQYSIWPVERECPLGWSEVGKSGPKAECLDYIKEVWTDMRPLSLRKKMADAGNATAS